MNYFINERLYDSCTELKGILVPREIHVVDEVLVSYFEPLVVPCQHFQGIDDANMRNVPRGTFLPYHHNFSEMSCFGCPIKMNRR